MDLLILELEWELRTMDKKKYTYFDSSNVEHCVEISKSDFTPRQQDKSIHDQKFICDGIAHGKSGYAVALSEIYKSFGNNNAKELSLKLMSDVSTDIEDYSWCKGRFGIYLAQYIVGYNTKCCLNRLDCKFYYSELKKMCENESRTCICHGTVGAFDCMLSIVHKFDFKLMDMYNMALQGQTLDCLKTFKTARYQYESFMLGTAGIVYTSLRLFYKAPSLILLDLL